MFLFYLLASALNLSMKLSVNFEMLYPPEIGDDFSENEEISEDDGEQRMAEVSKF